MRNRVRVSTNLAPRHYKVLEELAQLRSETVAQVVREALLRYLAELSYLGEEDKKALGVSTEQKPAKGR